MCAMFDYRCEDCDRDYIDVYQPIGSDAIRRCPEGHRWARLIVGVRIERGFTGPASLSPQMETFWETGDPELAFPRGKPAADAFTLDDLSDEMIEKDLAPDSPSEWVSAEP
jgi:hypothetical protein